MVLLHPKVDGNHYGLISRGRTVPLGAPYMMCAVLFDNPYSRRWKYSADTLFWPVLRVTKLT